MVLTRSTDSRHSAKPFDEGRRVEWIGLLIVTIPIAAGVLLDYSAKGREFSDAGLTDVRSLSRPETVRPIVANFGDAAEQEFLSTGIADFVAHSRPGTIQNVGALAAIRVDASAVSATVPEAIRRRLENARSARPNSKRISITLLTRSQFEELKPRLAIRNVSEFRARFVVWMLLYFAAFYTLHFYWRARRFDGDRILLPLIQFLTGVGIILMVSLRDPLRDRLLFADFAQGVAVGCLVMAVASGLDYRRLAGRLAFLPALSAFLLSGLLIVWGAGPGSSDAKVNLGPFQPVEATKLLLVFFFAGYLANNWMFFRQLKESRAAIPALLKRWNVPRLDYFLPVAFCVALALGFFFLQKDLGPALVISCLFLTLYAMARGRATGALTGLLLIAGGFLCGYLFGVPHTVSDRIDMFVHPWDNMVHGGNQLAASLWAIAGGGGFGSGPGLGDPKFVPASHTDLILSAVGEETGFAGLFAVFLAYAVLACRGFRIASRCGNAYNFFLSLGATLLLVYQLLLISGGVLGLFPLSGVVSPFLSYGRTAMLANFAAAGILCAISNQPAGEAAQPFLRGLQATRIVLALLAIVIFGRIGYLQIIASDRLVATPALVFQQDGVRRYEYNPRLVSLGNELARGSIYDRNGVPLATSSCEEIDRYRVRYAEIGVLPGICSAAESRHYPFGPLTFHLLGDVRTRLNWGARNTAYIERDAASRLRGYTETAVLEKSEDPAASVLVRRDYSSLVPLLRYRHQPDHPRMKQIRDQDRSVGSTIDIRFTALVSEIFKKRLRLSGSDKGAIVVIDAGTGDVLAAVSEPTLAATFESTNTDELLDRGRYGLYPPGSTFKLVTAAAALRLNPGLAETELECRRLPGGRVGASVRGGLVRDDVTDREPHGKLRMERAIAVSCNAYFAQLAEERLGPAPLFEMATMLDLTVAHPNTPSQLRRFLPQAAYGQGEVLVTPFQMARVAAMVADGGSPPRGRWVLGGGQDERPTRAVLSAENAAFLAHSMRLVVTEGTGTSAFDSPVPIAGKTGTAEIAGAPAHAWFVGFAPYGQHAHRTIAFAILVENGRYGGKTAAPIAAELVRAAQDCGLI